MESEQMVQGLAQWSTVNDDSIDSGRESSSKWMCSVAFCVSNGEFWSVEGIAKRTLSCSSPLERYKCLTFRSFPRFKMFHLPPETTFTQSSLLAALGIVQIVAVLMPNLPKPSHQRTTEGFENLELHTVETCWKRILPETGAIVVKYLFMVFLLHWSRMSKACVAFWTPPMRKIRGWVWN